MPPQPSCECDGTVYPESILWRLRLHSMGAGPAAITVPLRMPQRLPPQEHMLYTVVIFPSYCFTSFIPTPQTLLLLCVFILLWVILILATLNAHPILGGALRLRLFLFIFIIFLRQLENHPGSDSRLRPLPDVAGGFDNPVQPLPKRRWIRSLATSHFPMSDPNPARPIPQPLSKPRTRAPVD